MLNNNAIIHSNETVYEAEAVANTEVLTEETAGETSVAEVEAVANTEALTEENTCESTVAEVVAAEKTEALAEETACETSVAEAEAVANTEALTEEAANETLTVTTAPIINAVTLPKKKITPPPKFDYEQYRFRPTDYIEKLPIEIEAEELIALHPDKEDVINRELNDELKDYFGVVWQKNREVIAPNQFADALITVLPAKIYTERLFLYNNSHGRYEPISKNRFQEIAMYILKKLSPDLYEPSKENTYTKAFYKTLGGENQFDYYEANSQYIAFTNGTLDLFSMEFTAHSPNYDVTNFLNYSYESEAECPEFEKTLNIIFQSDQKLISSFQEMFGSLLLHGHNDAVDKVFIFYGKGSNGKSLLSQILEFVLMPENCSAKPLADLSGRFGLANIYDMYLNVSTEEKRSIVDTSVLKALTSGDSITVEKKYQDAFKAIPHVKLLTCCNELPAFNDKTDGMLRRILVYPFNVRFVENPNPFNLSEYKRDAFLKDRLFAERAGILNWALVGLRRFLENGKVISMAPASKKYLAEIKTESDPVRVFVESCVAKLTGKRIRSSDVHKHYLEWLKCNSIANTTYNNNQSFHREFKEQLLANQLPCRVAQVNGYDYYYDFNIDVTYPLKPKINF